MLHSIHKLKGLRVDASDGEIGVVDDLYFDDASWTARYLVVRAGSWLTGRRVLISPEAVAVIHPEFSRLKLALTQRQVKDSPDISVDLPVSRQHELAYRDYYGWPGYWGGPFAWGAYPYPGMVEEAYPRPEPPVREWREGDPHLRSAEEIRGYQVDALGAVFGDVADFLMDERSWHLRYFVIDTRRFWGHSVLLPTELVGEVRWSERKVRIGVAESVIKQAPVYDPSLPVDRDWEERVHGYYGVPLEGGEERRAG